MTVGTPGQSQPKEEKKNFTQEWMRTKKELNQILGHSSTGMHQAEELTQCLRTSTGSVMDKNCYQTSCRAGI